MTFAFSEANGRWMVLSISTSCIDRYRHCRKGFLKHIGLRVAVTKEGRWRHAKFASAKGSSRSLEIEARVLALFRKRDDG